MARPFRLKLPRLPPASTEGDEFLGERLARFRKERGFTQVELAQRIGITPGLTYAEMVVRFALATDEVLGVRAAPHPVAHIARTIDAFLGLRAGSAKGRAA